MRQAMRAARDTLRVRKQSAIRHIPRSCDVFVALTRVVSDAGELDPISGTSERYGRLLFGCRPLWPGSEPTYCKVTQQNV